MLAYKNLIYFHVFFLFITGNIASQNVKEDLASLSKKYSLMNAYETSIVVNVYDNLTDTKVKFTSSGKTAKNGTDFYVSMLNRKTIVAEEMILIVDEREKFMMLTKISKEQLKAMVVSQTVNFDSIMKIQNLNATYLSSGPLERTIEIISKGQDIEKTQVTFNIKTLALKEIVYIYSREGKVNTKNAKVVIKYLNFSFNILSPGLFDQSKYVIKKGSMVIPSPAYKNYKIINSEDFKYE